MHMIAGHRHLFTVSPISTRSREGCDFTPALVEKLQEIVPEARVTTEIGSEGEKKAVYSKFSSTDDLSNV